jgi:hypothetical protein
MALSAAGRCVVVGRQHRGRRGGWEEDRVLSWLSVNGAASVQNVKWKVGDDGPDGPVLLDGDRVIGAQDLAVVRRPDELFETAGGAALVLNLSASTAVGGVVQYTAGDLRVRGYRC